MSRLDDLFELNNFYQKDGYNGYEVNKPFAKQQIIDLFLELAKCDPPYKGNELDADGWKEYNRKQYSMRDIDIAVESAFAGLRQKVNEL